MLTDAEYETLCRCAEEEEIPAGTVAYHAVADFLRRLTRRGR